MTRGNESGWYLNVLALAILGVLLGLCLDGCGPDNQLQAPQPNSPAADCPLPVANTGGDIYFSPDASQAKYAKIGSKQVSGTSCRWIPSEGLNDSNSCQPILSAPQETKVYTLFVKNQCGESKDDMRAVMLKPNLQGPLQFVKSKDKFGVSHDYPTGYVPGHEEHYRAQYLHMPENGWVTVRGLNAPDELDLTPPNFKVNRQPQGSCWAEGGRTAGEATLWYVLKKQVTISAQRIIDCSGFGSASGGGQISIDDFLSPKGMVYESDYPYNGHDNKCNKSAPFREQAKNTYFISNASGGDPSWQDIKNANIAFGAGEICGAASALGNGGWVTSPGGGSLNHCYGALGFLRGEKHDKPAGDYLIVQNSWGADWGIKGQGYYKVSASGKIAGNVLVENKFLLLNNPCPAPVADAGPDRTIKLIPHMPNVVRLGVKPVPGQKYSWSPVESLDHSDVAEPLAFPVRTTKYRMVTSNQCGEAHADVTVTVFHE